MADSVRKATVRTGDGDLDSQISSLKLGSPDARRRRRRSRLNRGAGLGFLVKIKDYLLTNSHFCAKRPYVRERKIRLTKICSSFVRSFVCFGK